MSEQTLEVTQPSVTQETSEPVEDVKANTEESEPKDKTAEGEKSDTDKEEPKLSEAEKIRRAMQKRIDRQTAATKAMQERLAQIEQENAKYKATAPTVDDAPKEDDFDSWEEYEKARVEHLAEKKLQERLQQEREKEKQQIQERQLAETRKKFEEKENALRASRKDYDAVAGEAVETMNALAQTGANIAGLYNAVMAFDNPPELIYQLGKDTTLIEELVAMPPLKAMRELVKMEIALNASVETEDKKAPAPIKGVGAKGGPKPLHERSARDVLDWVRK